MGVNEKVTKEYLGADSFFKKLQNRLKKYKTQKRKRTTSFSLEGTSGVVGYPTSRCSLSGAPAFRKTAWMSRTTVPRTVTSFWTSVDPHEALYPTG